MNLDILFAHPIKFARSLALTSTLLLPACAASSTEPVSNPDPSSPPAADSAQGSTATAPAPDSNDKAVTSSNTSTSGAQADAGANHEDEADSGPKVSGPLPPPELPESFA